MYIVTNIYNHRTFHKNSQGKYGKRFWFRIALLVPNDLPRLLVHQGSLNRHLRVAEKGVWIDFGVFGLFKVSIQFDYVTDMTISNESVLVSEIPFHQFDN